MSIADLTGIEAFTNLNTLNCTVNSLTSLNVSANTDLTSLLCFDNPLTSLDVSANTALILLWCSSNLLTSLDVSANTGLVQLICSGNQLTSLGVSTNTALTYLNCSGNQLTSLDVSTNTALTYLNYSSNQLTSLNVSANTALTYLDCSINPLTSLDVSTNTALTYLDCTNNPLTSLNLSTNTALTSLYCYNNQLTCLNVKNGNNANMATNSFYAQNNSNLSCIQVDNVAYSTANWTNIDATASFSIDCGQSSASFTSNAPVCFGSPVIFSNGSTLANSWLWNFGDGDTSTLQNPSHTYPSSGNFMVTITASSCYSSNTDSATITVNPAGLVPTISIAAVPAGAICAGTNVTFTASITNGGGAPFYQWQVNGANVGINSPSYSSSTLTNGQMVTCILTSNATCASPATVFSNSIVMVVNPCVGIEANNINSITVFPNPTTGIVNIISAVNGIQLVSVTNMLGEVVLSKEINLVAGSPFIVDITNQPAGIYLLRAGSSITNEGLRIIKQ